MCRFYTQIVATARSKMLEIQAVVSIAAHGTRDCVEYTVAWVTGSSRPAGDQAGRPLAKRGPRVGKDLALMARGPLAADQDAGTVPEVRRPEFSFKTCPYFIRSLAF